MSTQTADNFLKEKSTLEATILEEVRFLQRELSADKCRPISMLNIVSDAVYNIVSAITIGERYILSNSVKMQKVLIIRFLQEKIRFGPSIVSYYLCYRLVPFKYLLFLIHKPSETNFSVNWIWQIKINRRGKRKARKNKDSIHVPDSKRIA